MSFSRRHFIASASGVGRRQRASRSHAFAQGAPIKLGSVLDNSGNLDVYGKPMVHGDDAGGRGDQRRRRPARPQDPGRPVRHASPTSRSTPSTRSSSRATTRSTSSTAASPRPRARRSGRPSGAPTSLYFYNVLYEGGVCDRNCVVTGTTPAQAVEPIVEIAHEAVGQEGLRARGRLQLRPDHRQVGRALRQAARRHGR